MTKHVYDACSRPFWVYAVTALPAFLELWFTLSTLDLEDLARSRGFSESGKDLYGGRRGRRHGGLKLPRGEKGKVIRYSALGLRTLLIVTIPLEIIGFAMLLYFSTDKFFYRWSSLLENIRCEGAPRSLIRSNSDFGVFPGPGGGAIGLSELDQTTGIFSSNAFGASMPFGIYDCTIALNIKGETPLSGADYAAGFEVVGALGPATQKGSTTFIAAGRGGTVMHHVTLVFPLFSGGSIAWALYGPSVPVGVQVESAHLVVHQAGG